MLQRDINPIIWNLLSNQYYTEIKGGFEVNHCFFPNKNFCQWEFSILLFRVDTDLFQSKTILLIIFLLALETKRKQIVDKVTIYVVQLFRISKIEKQKLILAHKQITQASTMREL